MPNISHDPRWRGKCAQCIHYSKPGYWSALCKVGGLFLKSTLANSMPSNSVDAGNTCAKFYQRETEKCDD